MQFMQKLTLISAQRQFIIYASHIPGHNSIADSLSHFSFKEIQTMDSSLRPSSDSSPHF